MGLMYKDIRAERAACQLEWQQQHHIHISHCGDLDLKLTPSLWGYDSLSADPSGERGTVQEETW